MSEIINIDEACAKLYSYLPGWKINRGLNYREYFVFDAIPTDYDVKQNGSCPIDLTCVRKRDGKVFGFQPTVNDPDKFFEAWNKYSVKNLPSE